MVWLENITSKDDIGLYRDDGLILLRELNGQQTNKIKSSGSSHLPSTRDYAITLPMKLCLNRPS